MSAAAPESVSLIRQEIATRVGPQRYNIWFKNTTDLTLTDHHLKVGVPNQFIGSWLESNLTDCIAEAARHVTGHDVRVVFAIAPSLSDKQRKTQLDSQAEFVAKNVERQVRQAKRNNDPVGVTSRRLRLKLDTFVVGDCNRMAYEAVRAVVDGADWHYRTLFVHGASGLGKTHLLQGTCNALASRGNGVRWVYVSCEEFTNQFVYAVKSSKMDQFRERFRNVDVLVLDDIHFLAGRKGTQEEFLFTFNAIDAAGKVIIVSSDTHPRLIGGLCDPLTSRFLSGMLVKVDPPDRETRCRILRQRAGEMGKKIGQPVIEFIADRVRRNVRELEGALLKLTAQATILKQPISIATAQEALQDHIGPMERIVQVSDIVACVATFFGVSPADINASRKSRNVTLARSVAMYLARDLTKFSFPEIGRLMGKKNHATVLLACRRITELIAKKGELCWTSELGPRSMQIAIAIERLAEQLTGPAGPGTA